MENSTSVLTLTPGLIMTDENASETNPLNSAYKYLLECEKEIKLENWDSALNYCYKFLFELPVSNNIKDKDTTAYKNFRLLASRMLANHHSYDSIVNLLNISRDMTDFTTTFFQQIDKKGVHLPQPKPNKETTIFIYTFCLNFFNLISKYLYE